MYRSDWLFFLTVGGLLILAIASIGLINRVHESDHAYSAAYQQYESMLDSPAPQPTVSNQSIITDGKSYREEWRDEHDLDAQREMAKWAMWMVILSGISIGITALGVVYVAQTLGTSQDTIILMRETSERELRAYVDVFSAEIEQVATGGIPRAIITLSNKGQTPAYELGQWSMMGIAEYPLVTGVPVSDKQQIISRQTIGPNGNIRAMPSLGAALDQPTFDAINRGDAALYVVGEITYKDAFGNNRTSNYLLFSQGEAGMPDAMAAYITGNHST